MISQQLECFLDEHKIRISCTNLRKLSDLYQNCDSDADRDLTGLLISKTLSNRSLTYVMKENNLSLLLNYQHRIDDPTLIEIIRQNIGDLIRSVLLNDRMPTYIMMKRADKIAKTITYDDSFLILPIIANCAHDTFMKHSIFPSSILWIIIKTPQGIGGTIIHSIVKDLETQSDPESDDITIISSCDINIGRESLVTSIGIVDPEKNVNINHNTIRTKDNVQVQIEALFNIVCNTIITYTGTTFINEYDELLAPLVNTPLMSPDRILPIIIRNASVECALQFIKQIPIICDESVVRKIATSVPNMYKLLFTHQFDFNIIKRRKLHRHISDDDSSDEGPSPTSYIDIFFEILKQTADFMDSTTIDNIIMIVHGMDTQTQIQPLPSTSIQTLSNRYVSKQTLSNRYVSNRDEDSVQMKISSELFNIEAIKIINTYFPVQLLQMIQKLFLGSLCVFNLNTSKKCINRDYRNDLINYTRLLNLWGYLPYDRLCGKYLILMDDVKVCPLCLTETKWSLRCKHAMCRRCFVDSAYTLENMNRYKGLVFDDCITCTTTKRMKRLVNDAARDNRDRPIRRLDVDLMEDVGDI